MSSEIRHRGVVESVADGMVRVRIEESAACASCGAAGRCHAAEGRERMVEVAAGKDASLFAPGMAVTVAVPTGTGRLAVVLAFVVPLGLMVLAAAAASCLSADEVTTALAALGVVVAWWIVLWLLRSRLSRFKLRIEK